MQLGVSLKYVGSSGTSSHNVTFGKGATVSPFPALTLAHFAMPTGQL